MPTATTFSSMPKTAGTVDWDLLCLTSMPKSCSMTLPTTRSSSLALMLRYVRVYSAKCSLAAADPNSCWQKIQRDTGLHGAAPNCQADYAREQKRTPRSAVFNDPTAIEYDAATTLAADGVRIAAVAGVPPKCRPQD